MDSEYGRLSAVPKGREEIRKQILQRGLIEKIVHAPNEGVIKRETLCAIIKVDGALLTSNDRIIRSAAVQWFQSYLATIRDEMRHRNVGFILEYPDVRNQLHRSTQGGRGLALRKFNREEALACKIFKIIRKYQNDQKRNTKDLDYVTGDLFLGHLDDRKIAVLRSYVAQLLKTVEVMTANITLVSDMSRPVELPSLDEYFLNDNVVVPFAKKGVSNG